MNCDLTQEHKEELLAVALFLEKMTPAKLNELGVILDADAIFFHDEEKDVIVTDIGGLVAYVLWGEKLELLERGGHLAAFCAWNERTGVDGGFYEKFTCLDEIWDAGLDGKSVTITEYGEALRHFVSNLPSPFTWRHWIDENSAEDEDEGEDDED